MWATLRDALGLRPGHATARGVDGGGTKPTLTDEERQAISRVYDLLCDRARELQSATRLDEARWLIQCAKTLQGLWERLSGTAAISGAGKSAPAANTPPELTDEERHAIAVVRNCAMTRAERFLTQSDAEREATLVLWRLRERLG
jgi:hypothetical protein